MSAIVFFTVWDFLGYLYWIYMAIAMVVSVSVVLNNRIPVKTIAWVLVILAIPYLGLFIYLIFGKDNRHRKLINKHSLSQIQKKSLSIYEHSQKVQKLPEHHIRLIRFFENVADAYPSGNNEVEILSDGYSFFIRLLREIYAAEDHIHIQFYIFEDDAIGCLLRDALIDRARDGIEVRLLYDDVGCWSVDNAFFEKMRCAGIYVQSFLPVRFPMFSGKVNYRNHRKAVVIDGRVAFIGGMNVAERYVSGGKWKKWRDIMLCVKGEAVYGIQISFLVDWFFADSSLVSGSRYFPKTTVATGPLMQIVISNPIGDWREMLQGMTVAISNCREYFYIQTPYFMPSDFVLSALLNLALSGVDVRIMVPENSDSKITELASRSYLGDVMSAGVKVYLYKDGFLHSKMLVSDDSLVSVGSANIDFRSFECNFEINSFVYDNVVACKMKALFIEDMRNCRQFTYREYKGRSMWQRYKESSARLFSPIL